MKYKFHDDIYLWQTICNVVNNETREDIYNELYGKTWTIRMIEELM